MSNPESLAVRLARWDGQLDGGMQVAVRAMRHLFLLIMIVYLLVCMVSLAGKLFHFMLTQGAVLDFLAIKNILTDALLTLIILAIVRTLFISNGFDYALAFLEIGFVVLVRKLLLLDTVPEETGLLLVLGVVSALFFGLIILIYNLKHRWAQVSNVALEKKAP
jgi:membrane-associated HD superfamily phosphohydrolase